MPTRPARRTFRPRWPVDLRLTLGPAARFPTSLVRGDGVWRATRTPAGPATVRVRVDGGLASVESWGDGAEWALEAAPALLGGSDAPDGFRPRHPLLARLHRLMPGLRIPRTGSVFEALLPAVLEQKVTGREARRAYAKLVGRHGAPAPGPPGVVPAGLRLAPGPEAVAALPYHALHPMGVERRRADTLRLAARHSRRLQEAVDMAPDDARRRLQALPGLGPWTAAEVALVALGDADAVSVGDFHLPNLVSWCLAAEPRGDDDRMLELLEPYRGHRGRVLRLLEAGGPAAPRFGPRLAPRDIAAT